MGKFLSIKKGQAGTTPPILYAIVTVGGKLLCLFYLL